MRKCRACVSGAEGRAGGAAVRAAGCAQPQQPAREGRIIGADEAPRRGVWGRIPLDHRPRGPHGLRGRPPAGGGQGADSLSQPQRTRRRRWRPRPPTLQTRRRRGSARRAKSARELVVLPVMPHRRRSRPTSDGTRWPICARGCGSPSARARRPRWPEADRHRLLLRLPRVSVRRHGPPRPLAAPPAVVLLGPLHEHVLVSACA